MKTLRKTPVLFLIFNRPEQTRKVFEAIKRYEPDQIFIAADGPREHTPSDKELCEHTRSIVKEIDWKCTVKTLYRDKNLGCGVSVSQAITWFFDHVEDGIILEDDCVPHHSFFDFCTHMLDTYRDDTRIMMIAGTSFLRDTTAHESYFFSKYYPIWGWATWRRAWKLYDFNMTTWKRNPEQFVTKNLFSDARISRYYDDMFQLIEKGFDTWDIQWWFTCMFQSGLSVIPTRNLISNIGHTGTHSDTQGMIGINMPTYNFSIDAIQHPTFVHAHDYYDSLMYKYSHVNIDTSTPHFEPLRTFSIYIKRIFYKMIK